MKSCAALSRNTAKHPPNCKSRLTAWSGRSRGLRNRRGTARRRSNPSTKRAHRWTHCAHRLIRCLRRPNGLKRRLCNWTRRWKWALSAHRSTRRWLTGSALHTWRMAQQQPAWQAGSVSWVRYLTRQKRKFRTSDFSCKISPSKWAREHLRRRHSRSNSRNLLAFSGRWVWLLAFWDRWRFRRLLMRSQMPMPKSRFSKRP